MILFVSGRTDIVAFYSEWFYRRYQEGFVDVRNPFYPKNVSRINFYDVDAIVFCTKNPIPIIKYIDKIDKPLLFHITLTPYKKDIEPNVPDKKDIIEAIKKLANVLGKDRIYIRYDPVFLSDKYTVDYHIKAFNRMCSLLNGYTEHIIISFLDVYKNVLKNRKVLNYREINDEDYKKIGYAFSESARNNGMTVQTCFEEHDLIEYGFIKSDCMPISLAYFLTGKTKFKKWNARKEKKCNCVEMVDIGVYNTCQHFCKYCYANYDEKQVINNCGHHDKNSSLLIGTLQDDDIIKIRT